MFTSRAEFRSLLRQDNADIRLTPIGFELGLANAERFQRLQEKINTIEPIISFIREFSVSPENVNPLLTSVGTEPIVQKQKLYNILLRPQVSIFDLFPAIPELKNYFDKLSVKDIEEFGQQVEITIKYESYIKKEHDIVDRVNRYENIRLSEDLNYHQFPSLSMEARQKLSRIRPRTLGQASRISGISPSDISSLMIFLSR